LKIGDCIDDRRLMINDRHRESAIANAIGNRHSTMQSSIANRQSATRER
jgi:hypothetical protein